MSSQRRPGHDLAALIASIAAVVLHGVVGIFHWSAGLVAPGWAVVLLNLEWVLLALLLWRWRRQPMPVLAVPFMSGAIWFAVMTFGDRVLGWTA